MISHCKSMRSLKRITVLLIPCMCCYIVLSYLANPSSTDDGYESDRLWEAMNEKVVESLPNYRNRKSVVRWTYNCSNNACIRREAGEMEMAVAFDVCWLTCGSYGSNRSPHTVQFLPEDIQLTKVTAESESVRQLIQEAFKIKQRYLRRYPGLKVRSKRSRLIWPFSILTTFGEDKIDDIPREEIKVSISTNQTDEMFTLRTDEAYEISIKEEDLDHLGNLITDTEKHKIQLRVHITGSTFFGVRHGIETFGQLIAYDNLNGCLQIIRSYYAYDKPYYPYRGILIDSSRNFIPMDVVKRVVAGMAFNKLNILHMHLTDSNTFPFYSKRVPQISDYGAISPDQIYYPEDLKDLVQYAKLHGVKVIPELDAPAHAGNGWQFGPRYGLGDLAFYINMYNGSWQYFCGQPPCGLLNIKNNNTYDVLENLYADLLEIFDKDLFHMGGDEVNLDSWKHRPELANWLKESTPMELWKFFQTEAFKRLRNHSTNVTAILWTSHLTEEINIAKTLHPENYIIQVWGSASTVQNMIDKGYSVIISISDQLYLDWGCGTWLGNNHMWKYLPWQKQYYSNQNFIRSTKPYDTKQVLGAEAPLWGEKVGPYELEIKLWPRAAALAESFWSNPKRNGEVYTRINYHNHRMRQRGIPTSQLQPESCLHFEGDCEHPHDIL